MFKTLQLNKVILLCILFISTFSLGQQSAKFELTSEWQLLETKNSVNFYVKKSECTINGMSKPLIYALLKIENVSDTDKSLAYNFGLQYAEGCSGCIEGYEFYHTLKIPAKTSIEGICNNSQKELIRLIYNPNLAGGWKFENPVIKNLTVE
jgi:hypothetical protein